MANKFANLAFTRSLLSLPVTSIYSLQISLAPVPSIFKWIKPGKDASSSTLTLEVNSCSRFELEADNASIRKRYSNLSRWVREKKKKKKEEDLKNMRCHAPPADISLIFRFHRYYYVWFTSNFWSHCQFTFIRRGSFNETRNMDENLRSRLLALRIKRWTNLSTIASIAKALETSVIEHI